MLAMDIDERTGKLFQRVRRAENSVQIDSVSPGPGNRASDDEFTIVRTKKCLSPKPRKDGMSGWYLENRFELCFILTKTDLLT